MAELTIQLLFCIFCCAFLWTTVIPLVIVDATDIGIAINTSWEQGSDVTFKMKFTNVTDLYEVITFGFELDDNNNNETTPCHLFDNISPHSFQINNYYANDYPTSNCFITNPFVDIGRLVVTNADDCSNINLFSLEFYNTRLPLIQNDTIVECHIQVARDVSTEPVGLFSNDEALLTIVNVTDSLGNNNNDNFNLTLTTTTLLTDIATSNPPVEFVFAATPNDVFASNYKRLTTLELWLVNAPKGGASLPIGLYRRGDSSFTNLLEDPETLAIQDRVLNEQHDKVLLQERFGRYCLRGNAQLINTKYSNPSQFINQELLQAAGNNGIDNSVAEYQSQYTFYSLNQHAKTNLYLNTAESTDTAFVCYFLFPSHVSTSEYILMLGETAVITSNNNSTISSSTDLTTDTTTTTTNFITRNFTFIHSGLSLTNKVISIQDTYLDTTTFSTFTSNNKVNIIHNIDPTIARPDPNQQFYFYKHRLQFQLPIQLRTGQEFYLRPIYSIEYDPAQFATLFLTINATSPELNITKFDPSTGIIKLMYIIDLPNDYNPINLRRDRANRYNIPLNVPAYVANDSSFIDIITTIPLSQVQSFDILYDLSTWEEQPKKGSISHTVDSLTGRKTIFELIHYHETHNPIMLQFKPPIQTNTLQTFDSYNIVQFYNTTSPDYDQAIVDNQYGTLYWKYNIQFNFDNNAIPKVQPIQTSIFDDSNANFWQIRYLEPDDDKWDDHLIVSTTPHNPSSSGSSSSSSLRGLEQHILYFLALGKYNTPIIDPTQPIPQCNVTFTYDSSLATPGSPKPSDGELIRELQLDFVQSYGIYFKLYNQIPFSYYAADIVALECAQSLITPQSDELNEDIGTLFINPLTQHGIDFEIGFITSTSAHLSEKYRYIWDANRDARNQQDQSNNFDTNGADQLGNRYSTSTSSILSFATLASHPDQEKPEVFNQTSSLPFHAGQYSGKLQHILDLNINPFETIATTTTTTNNNNNITIPKYLQDFGFTMHSFVLIGPAINNYGDYENCYAAIEKIFKNNYIQQYDNTTQTTIPFFNTPNLTRNITRDDILLLSSITTTTIQDANLNTTQNTNITQIQSTINLNSIHHGFANTNYSIPFDIYYQSDNGGDNDSWSRFAHNEFSIYSHDFANKHAAFIFGIKNEWWIDNNIDPTTINPVDLRIIRNNGIERVGREDGDGVLLQQYHIYFRPIIHQSISPNEESFHKQNVYFKQCQIDTLRGWYDTQRIAAGREEGDVEFDFIMFPPNMYSICTLPLGHYITHPTQCYNPHYSMIDGVYPTAQCGGAEGSLTISDVYKANNFLGIIHRKDNMYHMNANNAIKMVFTTVYYISILAVMIMLLS